MNEYTCVDYRAEMVLLGLRQRLHHEELTDEERIAVLSQIEIIETEMGLD